MVSWLVYQSCVSVETSAFLGCMCNKLLISKSAWNKYHLTLSQRCINISRNHYTKNEFWRTFSQRRNLNFQDLIFYEKESKSSLRRGSQHTGGVHVKKKLGKISQGCPPLAHQKATWLSGWVGVPSRRGRPCTASQLPPIRRPRPRPLERSPGWSSRPAQTPAQRTEPRPSTATPKKESIFDRCYNSIFLPLSAPSLYCTRLYVKPINELVIKYITNSQ